MVHFFLLEGQSVHLPGALCTVARLSRKSCQSWPFSAAFGSPRRDVGFLQIYFTKGPTLTSTVLEVAKCTSILVCSMQKVMHESCTPIRFNGRFVPIWLASFPGLPQGEGRPGTHCLRMRWIFPTFQEFCITLGYPRVVIRHSRILSHNFPFQRRHE